MWPEIGGGKKSSSESGELSPVLKSRAVKKDWGQVELTFHPYDKKDDKSKKYLCLSALFD